MGRRLRGRCASALAAIGLVAGLGAVPALAAGNAAAGTAACSAGDCSGAPWLNRHKSPDERASLLLRQLTLDDKMLLLHAISDTAHARQVGPIPELCVPALLLTNGSVGVSSGGVVQYPATVLPAPIGTVAAWDPSTAARYGAVEGRETLDLGRNLLDGPDVSIARVPLRLTPQSFAYWNTAANNWAVQQGTYTVSVGTSSRDLPLAAHIKIGG